MTDEVREGEMYRNGEYLAEVTGVDTLTDHEGEWVPAVEFCSANSLDGERYVLAEQVFLETYDVVEEDERAQAAQLPANTRPPKPTQY
jgi:hypothetical protein